MDLTLGDSRLIVDACQQNGLLRNQTAYVLATAFWESARTMKPVREFGGESYLKKKKYYPYVGMGYVQLTWLANYKKASDKLGVDFVKNPKLLLDPKFAVLILVIGMKDGWFTGKRLADYITLDKSDFVGARRIINGTDKRAEIAAIAKEYDALLKAAGYGSQPAPASPAPEQGKTVESTVRNPATDAAFDPVIVNGKGMDAIREGLSRCGLPVPPAPEAKHWLVAIIETILAFFRKGK